MTAPAPSQRDDLARLAAKVILSRTGLVIPKLYAERIDAALRNAQAALGVPTIEATLSALETLPCGSPAWQAAIEAITVGETSFLRHREWFAEIEGTILEPLIEAKIRSGSRRIDIWSAACSTGEEAYSLALLVDRLVRNRGAWSVRIVASDINAAALATARRGIYGTWALREVDAATLSEWFEEVERGRYRVSAPLRRLVEFRAVNLCERSYPDPSSGLATFDLVICRNVLIYLSEADQVAAAGRLGRSLAPGGWLAVSPAEAIAEWYRPLTTVNRPGAIFFRNAPSNTAGSKSASPQRSSARTMPPRPGTAPARSAPRTPPTPPPPLPSAPTAASPATADAAHDLARRNALSAIRERADRGDRTRARADCEAFIAANRLDIEAHLLLATVCLEMGSSQAALEAARCAAYLDPDSAAAHYALGTILHRLGGHDAARRKMAVVLRLLQTLPGEAKVAQHLDTTAAALRESALGYLAGGHAAPVEMLP